MTADKAEAGLRVLMVSNLLPPQVEGGAERVAWREMRELVAKGHHVRGLTLDWQDAAPPAEDAEEAAPIEVTRVGAASRRSRRPGNEFAANRSLRRAFDLLIADFRPDLVHFHNLNGIPASLPARAKRRGIPVVVTFHDGWGICPKSFLLRPGQRPCPGSKSGECVRCLSDGRSRPLTLRRRALVTARNTRVRRALIPADRLLFPSRHHLELYVRSGYPRERCRLLPNPAPIPTSAPSPEPGRPGGALQLLYLGAIPAHKGLSVLLEALSLLPPDTARLRIHGPLGPDDAAWLERALASRNLASRVEHGGALPAPAVADALAACHALVFPSRCVENSPLAILEAMAAGRPVIASHVGGVPELVRDGETGLLFPAGDAEQLAGRIRTLAERSTRELMGARARDSVAGRSPGAHVEALARIYRELLVGS